MKLKEDVTEQVCPVTGLAVRTAPEWIAKPSGRFTYSFRLIRDAIIYSHSTGDLADSGVTHLNAFARKMDVRAPFVEVRSMAGVTGRPAIPVRYDPVPAGHHLHLRGKPHHPDRPQAFCPYGETTARVYPDHGPGI